MKKEKRRKNFSSKTMKCEEEISGALASHISNMTRLIRDPAMLQMIAHDLGWTSDYLKGYNEGVKFGYEWVLGKRNHD